MTIHTRSDAGRDFTQSIDYYLSQEAPRAARQFKAEVNRVYELISQDPYRYPADYENVRSWPLPKRFPFSVLYTIDSETEISVIAIRHHKRRTGFWDKRL